VSKLIPEILRQTFVPDEQSQGMVNGTLTTEFLHLKNPRNYKFLPPQYIS
jgi:hypothetical protein